MLGNKLGVFSFPDLVGLIALYQPLGDAEYFVELGSRSLHFAILNPPPNAITKDVKAILLQLFDEFGLLGRLFDCVPLLSHVIGNLVQVYELWHLLVPLHLLPYLLLHCLSSFLLCHVC